MQSFRRRIIRGGSWVIGGRVGAVLCALAVQFMLARILSPEEFGSYVVLASLVVVFALAAQLGLNYTVVRMSAEAIAVHNLADAHAIIAGSLRVVVVVAAATAMLVLWPVGPWLIEKLLQFAAPAALLLAMGGWIALTAVQSVVAEAFRGLQNMAAASVSAGLLGAALLGLLLGGVYIAGKTIDLQGALSMTIGANGLALAVTGGVLLATLAKNGKPAPPYRRLLAASWPAGVCAVALLATRHVDLWIIGARSGAADAALYGAAARLGDLASFPLMMVNGSIAPLIAELHAKGDRAGLERMLRAAAVLATIPALALAVPMMILAHSVMAVAYGEYYIGGAMVLVLFLLANLVNAATGSCTLALLMTGHQQLVMWLTLVAALTIGLGAWLVAPTGGPTGVAVVACSVIAVQHVITMIAVRSRLGILTAVYWPDARAIVRELRSK